MKKLGSELTTGDVVVITSPPMPGGMSIKPNRVVIIREDAARPGERTMYCVEVESAVRVGVLHFGAGIQYEVEDRAGVTAAELAMLVAAARSLLDLNTLGVAQSEEATLTPLTVLVDRLDPPAPPTLEEVLAALVNAQPKLSAHAAPDDRRINPLLDILERARRAGMLK